VSVFPLLAGQGWSVHKRPKFSTIVAPHVSGREVRTSLWQYPLWEFEATFDGLASDSASYPGLGAQSLQSLMGLFLQCQGQFGTFFYYDPTDYSVAAQGFATGDGVTTAFQLVRTLGGFVEPILAPFLPTSLTLTTVPPGPGGVSQYAPNNLFVNAQNPAAGFAATAMTTTAGQTDPFGGSLALLVTETATTAIHFVQATGPLLPSVPLTWSLYLLQGATRYCQIALDNGSSSGAYVNFDMQAGVVTASGVYGAASAPKISVALAGGGYWRVAVSIVVDNVSTAWRALALGVNSPTAGFAPTYLGSVANKFTIAFPQVEQAVAVGAPGAYNPTLASRFYGGPSVTANGGYVDPSAYSVSQTTGVIAFAAAPAVGTALKWSGWFAYICRFLDDTEDFEQLMQNLWAAKSVKFQSVR
jgi:hypothetical protein